jgi:hypothetical protein
VVLSEGRDLDLGSLAPHQHNAEMNPNCEGMGKKTLYFFGQRVGCNIEVLGLLPEQHVANAAAGQQSFALVPAQRLHHVQSQFP